MDSATFQTLADELAGRYRLETVIGRGAMATVVRAKDERHGRTVAIKILDPEFGAALGAARFLAEIRVTAGLQHPHLLPLFDSGIAAGFLYFVMPFIEGASLRQRLECERQLPLDDVVRITGMLAGALEHAHAHGVLHRDLKPDNILLQGDQPLLADFGIALVSGDAGRPRITQSGFSVGTPQYMSPEQASADRDLSPRSDQFALAAVAYEMLVGEPPHTGPTPQSILARRLTERPRPVHVTRPGLPEAVSAVLERALSPTPADRYPSATAFADALAVAARGPGGAATVTGRMRGTGEVAPNGGDRRRRLAATIVIAAVLALGAWWALTRGTDAVSVLPFDTVLTVPVAVSTDEAIAAARSVGAAWVVREQWGRSSRRHGDGVRFLSPRAPEIAEPRREEQPDPPRMAPLGGDQDEESAGCQRCRNREDDCRVRRDDALRHRIQDVRKPDAERRCKVPRRPEDPDVARSQRRCRFDRHHASRPDVAEDQDFAEQRMRCANDGGDECGGLQRSRHRCNMRRQASPRYFNLSSAA
jgi:tRNA A-37 threonylcarbamoyl transferase component Bud32